ncbi:MAG TPA: beta-ketoacyl-[acyl-carrier-protein] synthase family protein [Polyangia bacterium]|jgi:3-oxoacyl-[acyl-carrier-protein] synthase II
MIRRRVVVTGVGVLSAFGPGCDALRAGLRAGVRALRPVTLFDATPYRSQLAGEVPPFDAPLTGLARRRASRADLLGAAAAAEAVAGAGLTAADRRGAAVVHGTGSGGAHLLEQYLEHAAAGGEGAARASLLVPHQPATTTDVIAEAFGAYGPRATLMTACSSSATAIGYAGDLIRCGRAAVALAGGTEPLCRLTYAGFSALRAMAPEPCRPFDLERNGLTLGEGSATLVLEDLAHARARGARVLAELRGYGVSADAHHMTAPDPEGDGAARAIRDALRDAELSPAAIDYVNAHGTATQYNDPVETLALKKVFGEHAAKLMVSSTKAMTGHALGAAGAIEAAICVFALRDGVIPPTLGLEHPDPACDLDYVPGAPRTRAIRFALSNSFGFGGSNTALVLGRGENLA